MKRLFLFEEFNDSLQSLSIDGQYEMVNGKYNVKGDVRIYSWHFKDAIKRGEIENRMDRMPMNFNEVTGSFNIRDVGFTSLEGCPEKVGEYFDCSGNKLVSLEGGPRSVEGVYTCFHNELKSLKGSPKRVEGMYAESNDLTNLIGSPRTILGSFYLDRNYSLSSLEGIPDFIGGTLSIISTGITSLDGLHENIGKVMTERFDIGWNHESRMEYLKGYNNILGKELLLSYYNDRDLTPEEESGLADIWDDIEADKSKIKTSERFSRLLRSKSRFY